MLKQPLKLLVDTGAAVTVISERFFHDILRVKYALTQKQLFDSIKTANGGTVPVAGTASFDVSIGESEYVCDAIVVPNLSYNVVLGRDFLHKHRAVIDVGSEKVTFSENNTVLFATGDFPPVTSDVRCAKTFVIDGSSEVIIPAILTSFPSEPVVGLIEGVPKLSDRYHLLCASTLCKPDSDGRVTVRLLNPSDAPVLIHKGTNIGEFKEISLTDEIVTLDSCPPVSAVNSSAATTSRDAFHNFGGLPSQNLTSEENRKLQELLGQYQGRIQTVATVAAATVRLPAMETSLKSSVPWYTVVLYWLSKDSSFQSSQNLLFRGYQYMI